MHFNGGSETRLRPWPTWLSWVQRCAGAERSWVRFLVRGQGTCPGCWFTPVQARMADNQLVLLSVPSLSLEAVEKCPAVRIKNIEGDGLFPQLIANAMEILLLILKYLTLPIFFLKCLQIRGIPYNFPVTFCISWNNKSDYTYFKNIIPWEGKRAQWRNCNLPWLRAASWGRKPGWPLGDAQRAAWGPVGQGTPQSRAVWHHDGQTQCSPQSIKEDHVSCEVGRGLSILKSRVSLERDFCCSYRMFGLQLRGAALPFLNIYLYSHICTWVYFCEVHTSKVLAFFLGSLSVDDSIVVIPRDSPSCETLCVCVLSKSLGIFLLRDLINFFLLLDHWLLILNTLPISALRWK